MLFGAEDTDAGQEERLNYIITEGIYQVPRCLGLKDGRHHLAVHMA